jgi:hypothetical protein
MSKFMAEYSHLSDPDPEFAPYMAQMMAIPQIFEVEARRKRFKSVFIETSKKSYASALPNGTFPSYVAFVLTAVIRNGVSAY